jgi:gamma-glutamyltranspeptidase/glutathione hydrolase
VQKDLAATLERIARAGPKGFYEGETAQKIAAAIQAEGGVLTAEDLAAYVPVERAPLKGAYRGREIIAMAPPSSGGVLLIELLNILENFDLRAMGAGGANATHVMAEAMKAAFADRVEWLGDPDFAPAAPKGLLSKAYARNIADEIIMDRARPAREVRARDPAPYESDQTTHYSVVDSLGNAVAVTTTLNFSYGNGMVAAGTGVLLNNEMDDFAAKAGASNAFGLVGGAHNLPAPGKRPLSSMTPTIVLKDGKPEIVTGSPGGPRIITTVLETIVNILDFEMNAAEAMIQPRFHHQWSPDELRIEGGFSPDTLALLRAKGHSLRRLETMGSVATIVSRDGLLTGASDTRQRGTGAVGY